MRVMGCGTRRSLGVTVVAVITRLVLSVAYFPSVAGSMTGGPRCEDGQSRAMAAVAVGVKGGEIGLGKSEAKSIQPIPIPFKQGQDGREKRGILLTATGEPKSGTTWFGRVVTELCLQLCGNRENTWCEMGGLSVRPNRPAPWYEFEMLHAETAELFLHFKGSTKHLIPGLGMTGNCSRGGVAHANSFGEDFPCTGSRDIRRDTLTACLPDTSSPACFQHLPPLEPAVRRMAVIFRDARNIVISEHRMRIEEHIGTNNLPKQFHELEPFILYRFEEIVAWIHQRWVWHTTALRDISHVEFYEDLKAHPRHFIELADFMGLNCTAEEADDVWQRHTYAHPPGEYTDYGLSIETLEWMNVTMAMALPEAMLDRYGLTPMYT